MNKVTVVVEGITKYTTTHTLENAEIGHTGKFKSYSEFKNAADRSELRSLNKKVHHASMRAREFLIH